MPYGMLLQLLFIGLAVHYMLTSENSARSKWLVGGLLGASLLFARWMPMFITLAIQFLVSAYILTVYRLREVPRD
jgi:hypothetical protein